MSRSPTETVTWPNTGRLQEDKQARWVDRVVGVALVKLVQRLACEAVGADEDTAGSQDAERLAQRPELPCAVGR